MKIPEQDEVFSQMINTARILIVDYDINRFHSFGLYSRLLMDPTFFKTQRDPEFLKRFVKAPQAKDKMIEYIHNSVSYNPFLMSTNNTEENWPMDGYEDVLGAFLADKDMVPVFETDISKRLNNVLYNDKVEGFLLKYKSDPFVCGYEEDVKVFTSNHILDGRMAAEIVSRLGANVIFTSLIETAINIAVHSYILGARNPLTFYIANYKYNYDETRTMKYTGSIMGLEYSRKHSFISFDPFTSLSYTVTRNKEEGENESTEHAE